MRYDVLNSYAYMVSMVICVR